MEAGRFTAHIPQVAQVAQVSSKQKVKLIAKTPSSECNHFVKWTQPWRWIFAVNRWGSSVLPGF